MNEEQIFRLIKDNREAMEENLLPGKEVKRIREAIQGFLDKNLTGGHLLALRYRKFRGTGRHGMWLDKDGYPADRFGHISPWIDFFEKYYATKTIKQRLENENLWIESRTGGKELHLFVGEKGKDKGREKGKVHLIIDDMSGEIRIDRKDQIPANLLKRVEAILTTQDGKKIRTTMDFLETKR